MMDQETISRRWELWQQIHVSIAFQNNPELLLHVFSPSFFVHEIFSHTNAAAAAAAVHRIIISCILFSQFTWNLLMQVVVPRYPFVHIQNSIPPPGASIVTADEIPHAKRNQASCSNNSLSLRSPKQRWFLSRFRLSMQSRESKSCVQKWVFLLIPRCSLHQWTRETQISDSKDAGKKGNK